MRSGYHTEPHVALAYVYCSNKRCPEFDRAKQPPSVEVCNIDPARSAKLAVERREMERLSTESDKRWTARNADNCQTGVSVCECGSVFMRRDARDVNFKVTAEFLTCTNSLCRHFGKPLAMPRHSLYGASDEVVQQVTLYEALHGVPIRNGPTRNPTL